jgi:hypothetical protein
MFCQAQSGIDTLSGTSQKKRKLDLSDSGYSVPEPLYSQPGHTRIRLQNNVHKSPNQATTHLPHNFIRASTIKLLDTYQRCGQKVFFYLFKDTLI